MGTRLAPFARELDGVRSVDAESLGRDQALAPTVCLAEGVGDALAKTAERLTLARPSSCASEVIVTSGSPQATTQENGSRSLSTLTAKPWVVTPRETCTPIEAILRS